MKRFFAVFLTLALICALTIQACAWDGYASRIPPFWASWFSWFSTVEVHPEEEPAPDEEPVPDEEEPVEAMLPTPTGVSAKYTHSTAYGVADNSLQVSWNEVAGAEHYEVEITKADGASRIYDTAIPMLWIHAGDDDFITGCTHIYNAATHTYEPAAARVRAIAGNAASEWSEAKSIPCNALHLENAEVH